MSLVHSFSVNVAMVVGERKATILNNFAHWHKINASDERHCIDGHVWLYNTIADFVALWPYLSDKEVRTALGSLEDEGYLITGNYNEFKNNRTKWYALTEKACELIGIAFDAQLPKRANAIAQTGKSILPNGQIDLPKQANAIDQTGKSYTIETSIENSIQTTTTTTKSETAAAAVEESLLVPNPLPRAPIAIAFVAAAPLIEQHRADVLAAPITRDRECKNYRITPDYYDRLTNAFFDKMLSDAERSVPIEYYRIKAHFDNWMRKQVSLGDRSDFHPKHVPVQPFATNGTSTHSLPTGATRTRSRAILPRS